MAKSKRVSKIAVPKSWPACVRSGMLHVISLAQYAIVYTRGWAADSLNARVRHKAEQGRWLALVLDHHSRRIMGFAVFWRPPTSVEIRTFLGRVIHKFPPP